MTKNVGNLDRGIRAIIGLVIIGLGVYFQSWWGVIGVIPLATAGIGWCPPYHLLGISTCKINPEKENA